MTSPAAQKRAHGQTALRVRWIPAMAGIDKDQWDRLSNPVDSPLLEWDWLHQMEASGSIAPATGWTPAHLTLWRGTRLVAAAPHYIKTRSEGEFVFDHAWAQVAARLGEPYFPKLVGMSPVTPAVGYRFLIDSAEAPRDVAAHMLHASAAFCREQGLASTNLHFVDPVMAPALETAGYRPWRHHGYLWENIGYRNFDDFLSRLRANARRNIRRERRRMDAQGLRLILYRGEEIPQDFIPLMYALYSQTNAQFGPWGCHYLNREFFEGIFHHCRERLLFVAAQDLSAVDPLPIALALLITKGTTLIGRYWGARRFHRDLHFNVCYYAPIEWAIAAGIRRFDPGAGSPHKIRRGFRAVAHHSWHRFQHPKLTQVFDYHIDEVNQAEQAHIDDLNAKLPYHRPVN
ncbi:MAG: GNAT family N-acetyltransferase [Desulfosarcinaceae bacterium]|nr:GNAT family N-acetyltransferase [Desulfosarcinaceae bacterium]